MIPTDFITENTVLVQIGANDGIQDDFMRDIILSKNIKAHLLEPIPVFFNQLSSLYANSDRVFCYNVAIHEYSGSAMMTYVNEPDLPVYTKGLGTFDISKNAFSSRGNYQLKDDLSEDPTIKAILKKKKELSVQTLTLSDFLEKNNINNIDIFVTDTEGFDGIIFSQLDLKKYTPELIIMETHTLGEDQNNAIKAKLKKYNYQILVDGWDTVARKKMISSYAIIDEGATIGSNTSIWHFTHVRSTSRVGNNTMIGSHCYIDSDVSIGDNCKIQSGCLIYHPAKIGDGVFIGPGCRIINDKNPKAVNESGEKLLESDWVCEGVIIEDRASIGTGSIIMPGVTIGRGAIVGAGSIVTSDVAPNTKVFGAPARVR